MSKKFINLSVQVPQEKADEFHQVCKYIGTTASSTLRNMIYEKIREVNKQKEKEK